MVDPVRAVTARLPGDPPAQAGPRAGPKAGPGARTDTVAVIAGSFGLMVVVVTGVLALSAARRRWRAGPSGRGRGRHAA